MSINIIAVGGGGFSNEAQPGLDEYILGQTDRMSPRIGFIGTASGDAAPYIARFYARFSQLDCKPSHLDLFRRTASVADWCQRQDVIFVGGGNTKSMLAVWHTWGLDQHLAAAGNSGVVLAGISAGAICWFQSGVTDSYAGRLTAIDGLGLLQGSCCPHYSLEAERAPAYRAMIADGNISAGVAIDDGACVHFVDGSARYVVSGTPDASAYQVANSGGTVTEMALPGVQRLDVSE